MNEKDPLPVTSGEDAQARADAKEAMAWARGIQSLLQSWRFLKKHWLAAAISIMAADRMGFGPVEAARKIHLLETPAIAQTVDGNDAGVRAWRQQDRDRMKNDVDQLKRDMAAMQVSMGKLQGVIEGLQLALGRRGLQGSAPAAAGPAPN